MELLFRLMRKNDDGTFSVVGYEKHENGRIYHVDPFTPLEHEEDIVDAPKMYLLHDRKDVYTGVDVDGIKVFERDKIDFVFADYALGKTVLKLGKVIYREDGFVIQDSGYNLVYYKLKQHVDTGSVHIIGIEGVK